MAGTKTALMAALLCGAALTTLSACDNGPSAVAETQAAGTQMARADTPAERPRNDEGDRREDRRDDPVQLVDGKPMWSASRRYSAQENAERAFARNGEAFGARNLDDFVRKAHAFVEDPPKGVLTHTRANGDTLFYDPKANVFAVANREGAPRTMFKPDEGRAYWDEQLARDARRQTARAERRAEREDEA